MALQEAYQQFLTAPNPDLLASNASLHYITTLVTLNGPAEIMKHLRSQQVDLQKKEEKLLDTIESANALALQTHTTLEFKSGGGAYLPGLDDNFLADRVVTFPITHFVSFDDNKKILQVRESWDQGSLLKLIDVIGKTGRNWPIRDGLDQIKLITSSLRLEGKVAESKTPLVRPRGNSTHITRDPHASLFSPHQKEVQDTLPAAMAIRASAKPPPRDYHELFVGGEEDTPKGNGPAPERSESPSKPAAVPTKFGAGKNFAPSRLFDNDENSPVQQKKPTRPMAATRYQHFDFADGTNAQNAPQQTPLKEVKASKHSSQWNFDDFNTPAKVIPTKALRNKDVRHWGTSDDEVVDSPIKIKKENKPRKDAQTHFDFVDDGGEPDRPLIGRPRGAGSNTGQGLYKNLHAEENGGFADEEEKAIPTIANVKDRRKDFDPTFNITDDSPATKPGPQRLSEDKAKVLKMMDANWASYDQSPSQKENVPTSPTRLNGGTGKGPLSESTNTTSNRNDTSKGIRVGGNGMGGKKGTGRQWGFGDDSEGEEEAGVSKPSKFRTGKTLSKNQPTGGDFWDF